MSAKIYFENKIITLLTPCNNIHDLKQTIFKQYGIPYNHMYVTINGKLADPGVVLHESNIVRMCTRLIGGKGGFGSMLRAIGAQIEKTTNREACRDLSGRRLRDINEEKRLRKWLEGQEEREREAIERKQKKLEKLLAEPKIEKVSILVIMVLLIVLVAARPNEFDDDEGQEVDRRGEVPRVQIKVYRGPTKHDGHAPWGFWVKQPSDDK